MVTASMPRSRSSRRESSLIVTWCHRGASRGPSGARGAGVATGGRGDERARDDLRALDRARRARRGSAAARRGSRRSTRSASPIAAVNSADRGRRRGVDRQARNDDVSVTLAGDGSNVMTERREGRDPLGRLDGHAVGAPESKTDEDDPGHRPRLGTASKRIYDL